MSELEAVRADDPTETIGARRPEHRRWARWFLDLMGWTAPAPASMCQGGRRGCCPAIRAVRHAGHDDWARSHRSRRRARAPRERNRARRALRFRAAAQKGEPCIRHRTEGRGRLGRPRRIALTMPIWGVPTQTAPLASFRLDARQRSGGDPMTIGPHRIAYEITQGWKRLPEGWSFVEVTGVPQKRAAFKSRPYANRDVAGAGSKPARFGGPRESAPSARWSCGLPCRGGPGRRSSGRRSGESRA